MELKTSINVFKTTGLSAAKANVMQDNFKCPDNTFIGFDQPPFAEILQMRSIRLTYPAQCSTIDKADRNDFRRHIQCKSSKEKGHKSREEQEASRKLELVKEALGVLYSIKKMVYGSREFDASVRSYRSGNILHVHPAQSQTPSVLEQQLDNFIKTYWELGHEHKFITEIVPRRANECIVSITEPDYKNLNKNDIEEMYLLIMNGKVPNYAETAPPKDLPKTLDGSSYGGSVGRRSQLSGTTFEFQRLAYK
ncbi:hypothetical protein Tco_0533130 [Tanacetum coccineum]